MNHLDICKKCKNLFRFEITRQPEEMFVLLSNNSISLCEQANFKDVDFVTIRNMKIFDNVSNDTKSKNYWLSKVKTGTFEFEEEKLCPYFLEHNLIEMNKENK